MWAQQALQGSEFTLFTWITNAHSLRGKRDFFLSGKIEVDMFSLTGMSKRIFFFLNWKILNFMECNVSRGKT
jgi:hypothetical protein